MNNEDIIRREQFCQIVSEIRGSHEYLIVGIDVAKDKHHAFMGTATGKSLLRKLIFENNIEGFSKLLTHTEAVRVRNGLTKMVFGLEPTANYHKPLGRHLIRCGHNVVLVTGSAVKHNRRFIDGRWDKNDTKDAANVADLVSRAACVYYDLPSSKIDELRDLLSLRRRLKKEEHSLKMRIRNNLLAKFFPEFDRFYTASESESLSIVRWCLDPNKIAGMDFDQFFRMVTRTTRGVAQKLRLRKIHGLAAESIGCPMGRAAEFEASLLVEKLKQVRQQVEETQNLIEDVSNDPIVAYISARVLASIASSGRFDNHKQVLKLVGYDLCANRSGKQSDKAVPVISKNGNAELRYALYQAANVACSRDKHFIKYFTKLLRGRERERGIKTKMRVKLAAKLLVIAWTLMKRQESFDPHLLDIE
jgi:transposase